MTNMEKGLVTVIVIGVCMLGISVTMNVLKQSDPTPIRQEIPEQDTSIYIGSYNSPINEVCINGVVYYKWFHSLAPKYNTRRMVVLCTDPND